MITLFVLGAIAAIPLTFATPSPKPFRFGNAKFQGETKLQIPDLDDNGFTAVLRSMSAFRSPTENKGMQILCQGPI